MKLNILIGSSLFAAMAALSFNVAANTSGEATAPQEAENAKASEAEGARRLHNHAKERLNARQREMVVTKPVASTKDAAPAPKRRHDHQRDIK